MLSELYIENIAIIEKSSIDLYHGFNLFTGETGAGKSILIDSINLVLGGKASRELIRTGASRALVSARFTQVNPRVLQTLCDFGFSAEDSEILITREFSMSGRSMIAKHCCYRNDISEFWMNLPDYLHSWKNTVSAINNYWIIGRN